MIYTSEVAQNWMDNKLQGLEKIQVTDIFFSFFFFPPSAIYSTFSLVERILRWLARLQSHA